MAAAIAGGAGPPGLSLARLAATLEGDPSARKATDAAAAERRRTDPPEVPGEPGPAAARRARADEVHRAVDALVLMGELSADEPGRLALPGFGPATWRALGVLRARRGTPEAAWAAAVAALPLEDLGDALPPGLAAAADPGLAEDALRVLVADARRGDLRNALVRAEAATAVAAERGNAAGVRMLEGECSALRDALAAADAAAEALWDAGLRRAAQA